MEQYFITLQTFTLEEYEVWKQLNKYCNFETGVSGYTVNQLVVNSDKRLELTTQKVRTILKKFEKEGYTRTELNISPEELVERFVRADSSRSTDGNGLGLSIAQSLVDLQGGKLELIADGDLFKVNLQFPVLISE